MYPGVREEIESSTQVFVEKKYPDSEKQTSPGVPVGVGTGSGVAVGTGDTVGARVADISGVTEDVGERSGRATTSDVGNGVALSSFV